MNIELLHPSWLLLTPLLLIVSYALKYSGIKLYKLYRSDISAIKLPVAETNLTNMTTPSNKLVLIKWFMIFLLSLTLSQPVERHKIPLSTEKTRDIFFIIDISVGMSLSDYVLEGKAIDRLSFVKYILFDFINKFRGNRIGLMIYADDAYIMSPVTPDYDLIKHNINRIVPAVAGRHNNLPGALKSFLQYSETLENKPSVIVLSQGANLQNKDHINLLTNNYKQKGLKLYFIGLGSEAGGRNTNNQLIFDAIDRKILSDISVATGGDFFWAGKKGELISAFSTIKQSETYQLPKKFQYQVNHYYHWLLLVFLLVFIIFLYHDKIKAE